MSSASPSSSGGTPRVSRASASFAASNQATSPCVTGIWTSAHFSTLPVGSSALARKAMENRHSDRLPTTANRQGILTFISSAPGSNTAAGFFRFSAPLKSHLHKLVHLALDRYFRRQPFHG